MPEDEPVVADPPGPEAITGNPQADDGSIIDVMVVYTPASRTATAQAGIKSLIDLAVAETNQAYLNSQINTQLRLVYSGADHLYRVHQC